MWCLMTNVNVGTVGLGDVDELFAATGNVVNGDSDRTSL